MSKANSNAVKPAPQAASRVIDMMTREQYDGSPTIKNLEDKLSKVGFQEIEKLRKNTYPLSSTMHVTMVLAAFCLVFISGSVSVWMGTTMGKGDSFIQIVSSGYMVLIQLALAIVGTIAGSWLAKKPNKHAIGFISFLMLTLLFSISVCTGLAFMYYTQDNAGSWFGASDPMSVFFNSIASNYSYFSDENHVQKVFNTLLVVVFELTVLIIPILLKVINSPLRESFETQKLAKQHLTEETTRRELTDCIAKGENEKMKHEGELYRESKKVILNTRLNVLKDQITMQKEAEKLFVSTQGLGSKMMYSLFGKHRTPDVFIEQIIASKK